MLELITDIIGKGLGRALVGRYRLILSDLC
jgi:hypothetical protein